MNCNITPQREAGTLNNCYWFQWSDRKNLVSQVVRVELLDEKGNFSVQLPKVKRTGGTGAAPVHYGDVWF